MANNTNGAGNITEIVCSITPLTEKSWFDYAIEVLPSITTILIILVTYQSISRRIHQLKNEKIAEKDIEKLYEASHYFYNYLDSAGLFFSMINKKSIRIKDGRGTEIETFSKKLELGNNTLFESFSDLKKSLLIFKTLEANDLVKNIEKLHEFIIDNRKSQILLMEAYDENQDFTTIEEIANNYEQLRLTIEIMSENCIREIIQVKKSLTTK